MILLVHFVDKGGGVEPESNYPRWKRFHQNIERYPALNDSIAKLTEGRLPHISFHFIPSIFMMINFLNAQSLYFCFCFVFCFSFLLTSASLDPTLSMNSWLSKLESSGWLDHVQIVLSTAYYAAQCLDVQGNEIQA